MPELLKADRWVTNPPKVRTLQESYRRCKEIARRHYENFPVGSLLIPRRLQPSIFSVYAFARTADDLADEPGYSDAERILYLNEWEELFRKSLKERTKHPILWAVVDTIQSHDLPVSLFLDLLSAFKQDVAVRRYYSFNDVIDYCQKSANPIGRLVLKIFGYRDKKLFEYSDAICTALQLTNFWQDVSLDLQKNRIYIPQEDLLSYDVTEEELFDGKCLDKCRELIRFQVERTDVLFRMGKPLLKNLHGRLRAEIKCILIGGTRILRKIEKNNYDVLGYRPKLTVADAPQFIIQFLLK